MEVTSSSPLHLDINALPARQKVCPATRVKFTDSIAYGIWKKKLTSPHLFSQEAKCCKFQVHISNTQEETKEKKKKDLFSSPPEGCCSLNVCRGGIIFQVLYLYPHFLFESRQFLMHPRAPPHYNLSIAAKQAHTHGLNWKKFASLPCPRIKRLVTSAYWGSLHTSADMHARNGSGI